MGQVEGCPSPLPQTFRLPPRHGGNRPFAHDIGQVEGTWIMLVMGVMRCLTGSEWSHCFLLPPPTLLATSKPKGPTQPNRVPMRSTYLPPPLPQARFPQDSPPPPAGSSGVLPPTQALSGLPKFVGTAYRGVRTLMPPGCYEVGQTVTWQPFTSTTRSAASGARGPS